MFFWNLKFQVIVLVVWWLYGNNKIIKPKFQISKKHAQKLIILFANDFLKSETTKNGVHSFLKIKIGRVMTENAYFRFLMSKGEKCLFLSKFLWIYVLIFYQPGGTKGLSFSFSHSLAGKIKWKIKKTLQFWHFSAFLSLLKKKVAKIRNFSLF